MCAKQIKEATPEIEDDCIQKMKAMMPHPERAVEDLLCSTDGINVFKSLVERMN